jgi:hypothetical protein
VKISNFDFFGTLIYIAREATERAAAVVPVQQNDCLALRFVFVGVFKRTKTRC